MRCLKLILAVLVLPMISSAQKSLLQQLSPDYLQMQFAGNIGLVSLGVGYNLFKDHLHISFLDGYTPAGIAGIGVNTIAMKASYDLVTLPIANKRAVAYSGLGCNFETTGRGFYTSLPDRYADGYYKWSAVHATFFLGAKLQVLMKKRTNQRLEFYAETGTVDSYLYYYATNPGLRITDMFSAAIGFSYQPGKRQQVK